MDPEVRDEQTADEIASATPTLAMTRKALLQLISTLEPSDGLVVKLQEIYSQLVVTWMTYPRLTPFPRVMTRVTIPWDSGG
jgi:hypothetical protein